MALQLPKNAAKEAKQLLTAFTQHPNFDSACRVLISREISNESALRVWEKCKTLKLLDHRVISRYIFGVARRGTMDQLESAINQAHHHGKIVSWDFAYLQHYSVKKDYPKILETLQALIKSRSHIDPFCFSFCLKEIFVSKAKEAKDLLAFKRQAGEEEKEDERENGEHESEIEQMTPEMINLLENFHSFWQHNMKRGAIPNKVIENQFIDFFCRAGNTSRAMEILGNMKRINLTFDEKSFSPIFIALLGEGALDKAEQIWNTIDSFGYSVSCPILYAPLKALSKRADIEVLEKAFELCSRKGLQLTPSILFMVTHNLLDRLEFDAALRCIDMVEKGGFQVKTAVWNGFIVSWAKAKDPQIGQKAAELVEKYKAKFGPFGYRRLILSLIEGGKIEEAIKWFAKVVQEEGMFGPKFIDPVLQLLAKQGKEKVLYELVEKIQSELQLQFTTVNLNSVLHLLLEHNLGEKWMSWAEKEGIQKNDFSYNILISAHAKRNDEEGVLKYLVEMMNSGYKPNRVTLSSIMSLKHVKSKELSQLLAKLDIDGEFKTQYNMNSKAVQSGQKGEVGETQLVMDEMRANGLAPDSVTYTAKIAAYAKKTDFGSVRRVFFEMKNQGIEPTSATFMVIIKELAANKDRKGLDWWISQMLSSGVEPDKKLVNMIISYFVAADDLDQVQAWVLKMKELGLKPDGYTYNSFLRMLIKKGDLEAVDKWLAIMKQEGVQATTSTYNNIMAELYSQNYPHKVEHWKDRMIEEGLTPDMYSYGIWVKAAASNGDLDKVNELLGEMEASKVTGDPVPVYNGILQYLDTETLGTASHWIDRMKSSGLTPSVVTYSLMIEKCGAIGDKEGMGVWVQLMNEAGLKPNSITYLVLVKGYVAVGDMKTAERYMLEAERENVGGEMSKIYCRYIEGIAMHSPNAEEEIQEWLVKGQKTGGVELVTAMIRSVLVGYAKTNNISKSFEWLKILQQRITKLFFWHVSIVGEACARVGDIDGIRKTFEILQKEGLVYFSTYMDALFKWMDEPTIQKNREQLEDIITTFYPDKEQRNRIRYIKNQL